MGGITEDIRKVMGTYHRVDMGFGGQKAAVAIDLQETKSKENEKLMIFICTSCGEGFSEVEARSAHEQEQHGGPEGRGGGPEEFGYSSASDSTGSFHTATS